MTGRDLSPREDRRDELARAQTRANDLAVEYAEELLARETKSRRAAWIVTAVLIVICAAQAAAIALLLPLKEVVPYTIVVDRSTGFVDQVRSVDLSALPEDEAVTQAFLAQYVIARETFDPADFTARYRLVGLWSADAARRDYLTLYSPDNPANLNATTPPGVIRKIVVKKIDLLDRMSDPKRAELRLSITEKAANGIEQQSDWRATMSFRYTSATMRMEDRLLNPLGFQVSAYRLDAAPLPSPPASAPAPNGPSPLAPPPLAPANAPPTKTPPAKSPLAVADAPAAPTTQTVAPATEPAP
jgi:type IV secretion system protein VirB8